jgi:tetratricopeptide (TPR) repeat protein
MDLRSQQMLNRSRLSIIVFFLSFLAISLIGEDLNNLINQAKAKIKSGDAKKAAEMLNQILTGMKAEIRNHPRHAETWYYFSVALDRLGRKELAAKALDRARKLKQMHSEKKVEAQNDALSQSANQAVTDQSTNKDEEPDQRVNAVNSAYSLASIKNETAQNFYRKGAAYLEQGQLQAAADQFILACEAEPGNFELLEKTCSALDQVGGSYYIKAQKFYAELAKHDKMSAIQKAAQARANIFSSKADLDILLQVK